MFFLAILGSALFYACVYSIRAILRSLKNSQRKGLDLIGALIVLIFVGQVVVSLSGLVIFGVIWGTMTSVGVIVQLILLQPVEASSLTEIFISFGSVFIFLIPFIIEFCFIKGETERFLKILARAFLVIIFLSSLSILFSLLQAFLTR